MEKRLSCFFKKEGVNLQFLVFRRLGFLWCKLVSFLFHDMYDVESNSSLKFCDTSGKFEWDIELNQKTLFVSKISEGCICNISGTTKCMRLMLSQLLLLLLLLVILLLWLLKLSLWLLLTMTTHDGIYSWLWLRLAAGPADCDCDYLWLQLRLFVMVTAWYHDFSCDFSDCDYFCLQLLVTVYTSDHDNLQLWLLTIAITRDYDCDHLRLLLTITVTACDQLWPRLQIWPLMIATTCDWEWDYSHL